MNHEYDLIKNIQHINNKLSVTNDCLKSISKSLATLACLEMYGNVRDAGIVSDDEYNSALAELVGDVQQ